MAVVALNEIKGDPRDLLAKYDKVDAKLKERTAPPPGLLVHTCVVLDDGIRIANVWESQEQAVRAAQDEFFLSALRSAGFEPMAPTIHPVHNHINFVAMQGAAR